MKMKILTLFLLKRFIPLPPPPLLLPHLIAAARPTAAARIIVPRANTPGPCVSQTNTVILAAPEGVIGTVIKARMTDF